MALEGLLGGLSSEDKSSLFQGLLAGAGAALASRGTPVQAIGQGLLGGISGYAGGQQLAAQTAWRNMQAENAQTLANQRRLETEQLQRRNAYLNSAGQPATAAPAPGPTGLPATPGPATAAGATGPAGGMAPQRPSTGTGYTWAGLLQSGFTPDEAQKILAGGGPQISNIDAKDYTQDSLATFMQTRNPADLVAVRKREVANGVAYDPYSIAPGTALNDVNQPFLRDQNGNIVPNTPYQRFQLQKAAAGAARTNVRVENKTGESLAAQIGPMMKDSQEAATAAIKQVQAADNIDAALASGNVITGPAANARLTVDQWANSLGMGGKDRAERLANTRQAMQGLAQLTLQGRQQMRGQGAITENESRLAERAVSGDLSFTPAELQVLTNAARRAGQYAYGEHARKVRTLSDNPDFAPLVPFYAVPELPAQAPPAQVQPGTSTNGKIRRFNPATGKIE